MRSHRATWAIVTVLAAVAASHVALHAAQGGHDLILKGGRVLDGTGNPWYEADVAIDGDRIAAVGFLKDAHARRTLDVSGLVVAPGFIDMLGQSEFTVLADPHV